MLDNSLKEWDKANKGNRHRRREELTQKLTELNNEDHDEDHLAEIMEVKLALNMEANKEEIFGSNKQELTRLEWVITI